MNNKKQNQKSTKMRTKIPRFTLRFQLRYDRDEDAFIAEIMSSWRKVRKGVTFFRAAIQVFYALQLHEQSRDEAALGYVLDMFPALRDRMTRNAELDSLIQQFQGMLASPRMGEKVSISAAPRPVLAVKELSDADTSASLLEMFE